MSIRAEMFEKDQLVASIYKMSISLFKGAIERCEEALLLYGKHYDIEIYFEKGFLYVSGSPSWAYDHDQNDERLGELLRERFYLKSLLSSVQTSDQLYSQFLDDEAYEKYEKYE